MDPIIINGNEKNNEQIGNEIPIREPAPKIKNAGANSGKPVDTQDWKEIQEAKTASVKDETLSSVYSKALEAETKGKEADKPEDPAVSKDKIKALQNVSDMMSEEDYKSLQEEGISIESYDPERLKQALLRVKNSNELPSGESDYVAYKNETEEKIQQVAAEKQIASSDAEKLASKLEEANLPITEEILSSLADAMGMTGSALSAAQESEAAKPEEEEIPIFPIHGEEKIEFDQETEELIAKIARKKRISLEDARNLAIKLEKSKVPITENNLSNLVDTFDMMDDLPSIPKVGHSDYVSITTKAPGKPAAKRKPDAAVPPFAKEAQEAIKTVAGNKNISEEEVTKYAGKLREADLPVTERNLSSLAEAVEKADTVHHFSEEGKAYFIDHELSLTVENLYQSQYSSAPVKTHKEGYEAIAKQAEAVIEKAGFPVNDETRAQVRWLYENHLPVTKEALTALRNIENVSQNKDEDYLLKKMTEAMKQGFPPEKAQLDETDQDRVEEAMKNFDELYQNLAGRMDRRSITARRRLEEIRLKMTTEAGLKLLKYGVKLDTTELQKVVEGLKRLEREYYKNSLKEAGAFDGEENINLLRNTTRVMEELKETPGYALGNWLRQKELLTIQTLHETAVNMKYKLDKAGKLYESLMTKPRSDMGDSLDKAFRNVPEILNNLGLEDNKQNQRAVRILAYNRMEINKESIQEVKNYDAKVNALFHELKPSVTIEMIKRNINPLNTQISELTDKVREIKNEIGSGDDEKYSKYLWKLEKNGNISPEEKKGYIGIYRLLSNIQKTDGAAIGAVLNNGMELTLKNLLTTARNKRPGTINMQVDDSYAKQKPLVSPKEKITLQVDTAFIKPSSGSSAGSPSGNQNQANSQANKETQKYYQNILSRIMDRVSPDRLSQIMKGGVSGLMDMTLEKLQENLEQTVEDKKLEKDYAAYQTEKIRDVAKMAQQAVSFLENFHVEPTIKYIAAVQNFFSNGKNLYKEFRKHADNKYNQLLESVTDAMEDADTLQSKFSQLEESMNARIKDEYKAMSGKESHSEIEDLRLLGHGIQLARRLSRQEYYEIPIVTETEISCMNLTLVKGTSEKGKIQISMESETLGQISGEFQVSGQMIEGAMFCSTEDGLDILQDAKDQMKKGFKKLGLQTGQISAGYEREPMGRIAVLQKETESEPATQLLYQAAKVMVKSITKTIKDYE